MTDSHSISRRRFFQWMSAAGLGAHEWALGAADNAATSASASTGGDVWLAATWQSGARYCAGLVGWRSSTKAQVLEVRSQLALPSRAHGVHVEADGSLLVVARRPGDWLLRWHPDKDAESAQWHWIDDDHRFTGHVLANDGQQLWTTETSLGDARGTISLRDPSSLKRVTSWETGGFDPHMMLQLPQALGTLPEGTLLVANGGIPTLAETGRLKRNLDQMDASLVAFAPSGGAVLGIWTLDDPRLSIRHLTFDATSHRVGIGLQAQHDDDAQRLAAPVLAVFDGQRLTPARGQPALDGYGGDLCAFPGGGFLVGCPKSNQLVAFDGDGHWLKQWQQSDACSVDQRDGVWWSGGGHTMLSGLAREPEQARTLAQGQALGFRFDNHWRLWPFGSG